MSNKFLNVDYRTCLYQAIILAVVLIGMNNL